MKKLTKLLFALIIMSTVVFTSCIDYVVPYNRLPAPPGTAGMGATYLQEFDNVVRGKTWYSVHENTGRNTFEQFKIYFNDVNHTFIKEIYCWNEQTKMGTDKRFIYGKIVGVKSIGNLKGEFIYKVTDSNFNTFSPESYILKYNIENADIISFDDKKCFSYNVIDMFPNEIENHIKNYPSW